MAVTQFLEKNRIWLGWTFLLISWLSILLPGWARTTVVFVGFAIVLAGLSRFISDFRSGQTQPSIGTIEKAQIGLAFITSLIIVWDAIGPGSYGNTVPETMPLIALLILPRPRRALAP